MERRVIKGFTDKKTKQPYPRGSKYETVDKKRIKELVDGGYLEDKDSKTLEDAQTDFEEKVKAKHEPKLEDLTIPELKQKADEKGIEVEGTGKNGAHKKEDYINALQG